MASQVLVPGTRILVRDDVDVWKAAVLVVCAPAPQSSGGGLQVTYRYPDGSGQDLVEVATLAPGESPVVAEQIGDAESLQSLTPHRMHEVCTLTPHPCPGPCP